MIITPSQAWDRVKQVADREHDQAYDPQHLAAALLDLRTMIFDLTTVITRVDDDLTNMDSRFQHYPDRDYVKRIDRAVDELERKFGHLEGDMRRLK